MDITPLIDRLRDDLERAADLGGEEARDLARRLAGALDPALRLALIEGLSQGAAEIAAQLPGVSIQVRLDDRQPVFLVEGAAASEEPSAMADAFDASDEDDVIRITLRLPQALKARAEALAARKGQSLNTWLVGAARAAAAATASTSTRHGAGRRIQGWAR
ncbi:MAG TPA: toxin-antitoxin system HicB family antitoxin [Caulobacteraceae bacterium]|nr:toxin-antitoxin system HicB family antitoxin [Caulobacteraceae bacterium]